MTDETIFATALEKADPAQRAAFLAEACGDDTARRTRLEGLVLAHARAANFLERPPVAPHDADYDATQALSGTPNPGVAATQTAGGNNGAADDEPLSFLAPSTRPDALGRIGHYEVLQVLGRGGFGIVFRAFDDVLQRVVALKVLAPQLAATSPARKRFLREARSSAQIRHENVVQVYEVAEQPFPYLSMEFIPGETVQQKLDRIGPLDVPEALRIGRQIAEGLAAAHACDLIHRDIKPGNVMLEGGAQKAKITDFGLARAADDASISQSGVIAGTPMYMAPEQAKGETLDQRADLFSLGSVLYQMVAGRPPFRASSTVAVLKRVAEDTPRDIREIIPETPQWLCDIIAKLHAKNPDERYQSAREVADVLADCETQLKTHAKLKDYSRIPRSQPRRSQPWKWVATLAAAAVLVLASVWFGRSAFLFFTDRGELELLPEAGLVSVIVLQNNEGILDGNKLHAPVCDWLDMKQSHVLNLPPGRYQLNVGTFPAGTHVSQWEVTTSGLLGSNEVTVPVIDSSAIISVERGRRATLRANMRTDAVRPTSSERNNTAPFAVAPFTDADVQRFAALPAAEQIKEVRQELIKRNRDFDGILTFTIAHDAVVELTFRTDHVVDISPVRALTRLQTFRVASWPATNGLLTDLSPLQGMSLVNLEMGGTKVADLSPLKGMKLRRLIAPAIPASDLTPLQGMPITDLGLHGTSGVTDLKPLQGMPLENLNLSYLPMSDFSALKGITSLRVLQLAGTQLSDLTALQGLKLIEFGLSETGVTDLSPLKGMPLRKLSIYGTGIIDLTPLQGMPLEDIRLTPKNITKGLDILRDMKSLKTIGIAWDQAWPTAKFWERYDKGEFKD